MQKEIEKRQSNLKSSCKKRKCGLGLESKKKEKLLMAKS